MAMKLLRRTFRVAGLQGALLFRGASATEGYEIVARVLQEEIRQRLNLANESSAQVLRVEPDGSFVA